MTAVKAPTLYVTKAVADGVRFTIENQKDYPAGSKQKITFKFTAATTPIRDGHVRIRLPNGWTLPPALKEAKANTTLEGAGKVVVTSKGTLDEDNPLRVGGQFITVNIDTLTQGQAVTVTYGVGKATDIAVVQSNAQDEVPIYGYFKASANALEKSQKIDVKVTNAADGSGTATISASPGDDSAIQAGSSRSVISVTFTAAGTMTGNVALEIPPGWGALQRDPVKPNYIEVMGSGVSLTEPAIGSSSNRAVANITNKLEKGNFFIFRYGGGTGGDKNGVDAQNHLGPATFTIKSDGNDDEVYAKVDSDAAYDKTAEAINPQRLRSLYKTFAGELRIDVVGAAGGTGSATVAPIAVRAAEPVTLTFVYKATQTITDGQLKFTTPGGWSFPQTEEPADAGYTEVTGSGLGTATDDNAQTVTVPITFINKGDDITITYGSGSGQAIATAVGERTFTIKVRGTSEGEPQPIGRSPVVTVGAQASGKGDGYCFGDGRRGWQDEPVCR